VAAGTADSGRFGGCGVIWGFFAVCGGFGYFLADVVVVV
jgi:hypothetical protein